MYTLETILNNNVAKTEIAKALSVLENYNVLGVLRKHLGEKYSNDPQAGSPCGFKFIGMFDAYKELESFLQFKAKTTQNYSNFGKKGE